LAFVGGALTAGVLAGAAWLLGPFYKVLIGTFFVLLLCVAAAVLGTRGVAGAALLVGLMLLLVAAAWERRADIVAGATKVWNGTGTLWNAIWAALNAVLTQLTAWAQGFTQNPPVITPPPPSVIALLIVFLLAPAVLGSTILVRTALVLALAAAGIVAALRALALVRVGNPIELRARSGGFGGGQGGWRLSQPASSLLIAAVLLGAAVGLAQIDRRPEPQRPPDATPAAEVMPKKKEPAATTQESGKASETAAPTAPASARH
jgi:hypothetical protein